MITQQTKSGNHSPWPIAGVYQLSIDFKNLVSSQSGVDPAVLDEKWLTTHNFKKINHSNGYSFYHHKKYKLSVYLEPYKKVEWFGYQTNCPLNIGSLQNLILTLYRKQL